MLSKRIAEKENMPNLTVPSETPPTAAAPPQNNESQIQYDRKIKKFRYFCSPDGYPTVILDKEGITEDVKTDPYWTGRITERDGVLGTRGSRKKKEGKAELSEAKVEIVAEGGFASQAPQDFQDTGNIKLDPPALVRESVLISAETRETESPKAELSASKKPRGRPPIDKWATVEARIRGGEFASDCSAIPSKAKLAIYISRVLAEDNAFRPRMKDLLTELGHADLLSVFALR